MRTPIPPPLDPPPLRLDRPLPAYRYVPGLQVHPLRGGHGGSGLTPDDPPEHALQRGLDLLDHRYFWEAHEALEQAWHVWRAQRDQRAELVGGLVKLAACWLRRHAGDARAAERLLTRAREQLNGRDAPGLALAARLSEAEAFVATGRWPA